MGRKERSLKKFWKGFGPERAKLITHAVMDMWEPFRNSFQKHCPGIKIIYDKFHVIQHLLKALNDVRKAELKWSRLTPYHEFVRLIDDHLDGILAYCDKKVSLGYVERTNLTAKNVIRRAYGYGGKDYLKLKIIQACTPWMAQFRPWTVAHSSVP